MRTLLLFVFITMLLPAKSQVALILFEGQQFGTGNRISWTVARGNTCQDIEVQHSANGQQFTTLYVYPGICGNTNFDQTYTWTHNQPIQNAANYYRIITPNAILTDTINVRYVAYNAQGFVLFPQPATSAVQLLLNNPNSDRFTLEVYDLHGNSLLHTENITESVITIHNPNGIPGVYLFRLTQEGQEPKTGKLIFR